MLSLRFIAEEIFLSLFGRPYIKRRIPDCYILSYRKCGRTWLRMMVAKSLSLYHKSAHEYIFDSTELIRRGYINVPYVDFTHGDEIFKSDMPLLDRYRKKKCVFLVRDPRDVAVSYYFHRTKRAGESYDISDFIRHKEFGIESIIFYMNRWYEIREIFSHFTIIRYEDMKRNTHDSLKTLLSFIGYCDICDEIVAESVNYASIENMRKLSVTKLKKEKRLAPKKHDDPESYKVRKAKVNSYKEYLSPEDILFMENMIKDNLNPVLGYSPQ